MLSHMTNTLHHRISQNAAIIVNKSDDRTHYEIHNIFRQ